MHWKAIQQKQIIMALGISLLIWWNLCIMKGKVARTVYFNVCLKLPSIFGSRRPHWRDNKMVEILEGNHGSKEHGFTGHSFFFLPTQFCGLPTLRNSVEMILNTWPGLDRLFANWFAFLWRLLSKDWYVSTTTEGYFYWAFNL